MKKKYCNEFEKEVTADDCKNCAKKELRIIPIKYCIHKKNVITCNKCGEIVED